MKFALAALTLVVSFSASADITKIDCQFDDYQAIQKALDSENIVSGKELAPELKALLMEEMGPKCSQLVSDEIVFTIPGSRLSDYEISSADRQFKISISVNNVESSGNSVSITRK